MELASIIVFVLIVGVIAFTQLMTRFINLTQPSILGFYSIVFCFMAIGLLGFGESESFKDRVGYIDFLYALLLHIFFLLLPYIVCYSLNINNLKLSSNTFRHANIIRPKNEKLIFVALLFVFTLIFIHQLIFLPTLPIFLLFQNVTGEELALAREDSFKLNDSPFVYLWHFNRMIFAPLVTLSAYLIYANEIVSPRRWQAVFIIVTIFACINSSLSSALAPVAMIFLMIFLIRNYSLKKVSRQYTALMMVVVLAFPILVEFVFSDGDILASATNTALKVFNRFSIETFDRTLLYFDLFPYSQDYLGGSTNRLFTIFTGNEFYNVQNYAFLYYVENIMGDQLREHLMYGSLNANFIGYMNADFGLMGVVISSAVMGIILTYFEMRMMKLEKNIFVLSLYIMLVIIFWKMMGTQPASILVGHGGILMLLLSIALSRAGGISVRL